MILNEGISEARLGSNMSSKKNLFKQIQRNSLRPRTAAMSLGLVKAGRGSLGARAFRRDINPGTEDMDEEIIDISHR